MSCRCKCDCEKYLQAYELQHDMPGLTKGAIFVHDPSDYEKGNHGYGSVRLAWLNRNCQMNWCGGAIALPGQICNNRDWFIPVDNDGRYT